MNAIEKTLYMRKIYGYVPILVGGLFVGSMTVFGVSNPYEGLRINEVQVSSTVSVKDEFVELYNDSDRSISLTDCALKRHTKSGSYGSDNLVAKGKLPEKIEAKQYLVIANPAANIGVSPDGVFSGFSSSFTIAADNTIGLLCPGVVTETTKIEGDVSGSSWSYGESEGVWKWTTPTPKKKNIFDSGKKDSEGTKLRTIRLNEVLPNPEGKDTGKEFIELYNFGMEEMNILGWRLRDRNLQEKSQTGYIFPQTVIPPGGYVVVDQSKYGFSLNSTDETVELLDATGAVVDFMTYKTSSEEVSWAFDGSRWRASLMLTPGMPNRLNGEPQTDGVNIPKEGYVNVWVYFSSGGLDADGDSLKYRWDFGDGHRSYKQNTKHRYEEKGEHAVTLRVDDGKESREETHTIKIESYPHRKVKIVAIEPNPEGKDSEGEWIRVKNESKNTVDLNGWSIATGKDKKHLANHPIKTRVKIKKGKETTITRSVAKISLNNKKGVVELRYPNGERADRIQYEQKDGIGEGDVYRKEKKKGWAWEVAEEAVVAIVSTVAETKLSVITPPPTFVDPVSDDEAGATERVIETVARFGREFAFYFPNATRPRVAGAASVRLALDGDRYVFVEGHVAEDGISLVGRRVKKWFGDFMGR